MESKGRMLITAGAASLMMLAAGCANWQHPGGGNMTSYSTGSYPMPAKNTSSAANTGGSRTTTANNTAATGGNSNARANGDSTGSDTRTRTTTPTNQSTVLAVQEALSRAGYNPGAADGNMGPSTHQAVENFQKARGLRQTGELDTATLSALGVPQQ